MRGVPRPHKVKEGSCRLSTSRLVVLCVCLLFFDVCDFVIVRLRLRAGKFKAGLSFKGDRNGEEQKHETWFSLDFSVEV